MNFDLSFNPYQVLGVSPKASEEEVREAYRRMVRKYHPDQGGDPWAFHVVNSSYEMLTEGRLRSKKVLPPSSNAASVFIFKEIKRQRPSIHRSPAFRRWIDILRGRLADIKSYAYLLVVFLCLLTAWFWFVDPFLHGEP